MWYNFIIDKLKIKNMETGKTSETCCGGMGSKNKKILVIFISIVFLSIIVLAVASVSWKMHQTRNRIGGMYGFSNDFGRGQMIDKFGGKYSCNDSDQFNLPEDALKSGDLAVVVGDLEAAKKAVFEITKKNNGNAYKTFIAYASNNVKNGSIVVQVPAENFDGVFGELKKISSNVVQESTQQIAPRSYYPMPLVAEDKDASEPASSEEIAPESQEQEVTTDSDSASTEKSEIAIYPSQNPTGLKQDKAYIKVVFVDYGNAPSESLMMNKRDADSANILGIGGFSGWDMRNNLLVIVGVKLIFLVAILGLLVVVFKKIFNRVKIRKENKKRIHIVRQMPKTRARIVRIQKRK